MSIINLRVTHKKATIPVLEAVRLKDYSLATNAQEMVIIQTCNRVEVYAIAEDSERERVRDNLTRAWKRYVRNSLFRDIGRSFEDYLDVEYDNDALRHLFRLATGLESMIVGEDQIHGQINNAFIEAKLSKKVGPILSLVFDRAIKLGARIRSQTGINKGMISVGSVTVNLAEDILGNLENKSSLLIGAGEVGLLVAKALVAKGQRNIFVASRSLDRAESLAKIANVNPIEFQDGLKKLKDVDLLVLATSAPNPILSKEKIEQIVKKKNRLLLVIDLSFPRNTEESVAELPNIKLLTIDDLRDIVNRNLAARMGEIKHVEELIGKELNRTFAVLRREGVEPVITSSYKHAESIRIRELNKAIKLLGDIDFETLRVINDLSLAIVEGIMNEPVLNLCNIAENYDVKHTKLVSKLEAE
ncbi:MAG: glutamyl-tRNA reductase [Thaumarchaeota archaeon]|nr:glutamyl-tRNA reductase [Nitrososphaerota archaeon]